MDLNSLPLFAHVVSAGSFSAAARRIGVPVSTLSRKIAELENALGVRLLDRSTRSLRLTDVGADILDQAQRGAELADAVHGIVSNQRAEVSGLLRLSAPPSIADSLLVPILVDFQAKHALVRVRVMVTERHVDPLTEGIDLVIRVGRLPDSTLVARRLLRYRHQLVCSPSYFDRAGQLTQPSQLLQHPLLAFTPWSEESAWTFVRDQQRQTITFRPQLAMNDYAGLAAALLAGAGIGDLPPVVLPELLASGRLVEVMPGWHFRPLELSLLHLGNRLIRKPVRAFIDTAIEAAGHLYPNLPT